VFNLYFRHISYDIFICMMHFRMHLYVCIYTYDAFHAKTRVHDTYDTQTPFCQDSVDPSGSSDIAKIDSGQESNPNIVKFLETKINNNDSTSQVTLSVANTEIGYFSRKSS